MHLFVYFLYILFFCPKGLLDCIDVDPSCVREGGSVTVTCVAPKKQNVCNLYKRSQNNLLMTEKASGHKCEFSVSAKQLLKGERHTGLVTAIELSCGSPVGNNNKGKREWEDVHVLGRLQAPTVSVVPTTFSGTESVGLSCQAPQTLGVSGCRFYLNGRLLSDAPSCKTQFRGTDLLMGRNNNSVQCAYTVKIEKCSAGDSTSPQSKSVNVTLLAVVNTPVIRVNTEGVTEAGSIRVTCDSQRSGNEGTWKLFANTEVEPFWTGDKNEFTVRGLDILKGLTCATLYNRVELSCEHTAGGVRSNRSNTVVVAVLRHLLQATLNVSVAVISRTESVQLSCLGPPSVPVSQCHFYLEREPLNDNSACQLSLTGAELLRDRSYGAVTELTVDCHYIVDIGFDVPSPYSHNRTLTVLNLTPPNISVLLDDSQAVVNCEAPPHITGTLFHLYPSTGMRRVTQLAAAGESAVSFTVPHSHGSSYCCTYQYHNFTSDLSDCTGPMDQLPTDEKPIAFAVTCAVAVALLATIAAVCLYKKQKRQREHTYQNGGVTLDNVNTGKICQDGYYSVISNVTPLENPQPTENSKGVAADSVAVYATIEEVPTNSTKPNTIYTLAQQPAQTNKL